MTAMALVALSLGLCLATAWLIGAVVLRCVDRWPGLVAPRSLPALLLSIPLIAVAATLSAALISVEHQPAGASVHSHPHEAIEAHASLGRSDLARAALPFTMALTLVLAWRLSRSLRMGWRSVAEGSCAGDHVSAGLARTGNCKREILLADLGERNARAVAWPRSRILFDRDWWHELSAAERDIVVAHEGAHLRRHDPFIAFACCLASSMLPRRSWSRAFARWRCWAEQAADLAAARAHGDPLAVADLLIRQQRARVPPCCGSPLAIAFGEHHGIEQRVRALAFASTPASALESDLDWKAFLTVALVVAAPFVMAPGVHAVAEALLQLQH